MKSIISFLITLLLIICFFSCDGRQRTQKSHTDILIENKLLDSFSKSLSYYPENYSEHINDTILNNGFHVKIKTYSNMEDNVVLNEEKNHIKHQTYYRKAIGEITVFKDDFKIFSSTINQSLFTKHLDNLPANFNQFILKSIWVNQQKSLNNDYVVVDVLLKKPKSKLQLNYQLIISSKGTFNITKNT